MVSQEVILASNRLAIAEAIAGLDDVSFKSIAASLPKLLAEGRLVVDTSVYTAHASATAGASRYLLYDNQNPKDPVSIWVFALGEKQKTSIHDHSYRGAVTVLQGVVSEKYYEAESDTHARCVHRADRHRFHTSTDNLQDDFVHQLKRRKGLGEGVSVTLHIYNMSAHRLSADGEAIDNRNLNRIFEKIPTPAGEKDKRPPYESLSV